MKYVKTYNSEAVVSYFGKRQFCKIVVDEYATIWEITGTIYGHEFPLFCGRYKKSKYKDNLQAISAYIAEVGNKYK